MTRQAVGIALALASALTWGGSNVLLKLAGCAASQQTLGLALGNLVISLVVFAWGRLPSPTFHAMLFAFMSGVTWAIGMRLFLSSIPLVGIARAVPVCGSLQVAFNMLFGGLVMNEWPSSNPGKLAMICGVVFILASMPLATWGQRVLPPGNEGRGTILALMAGLVFSFYVAPIRYFQIPGRAAGLPQAVGMVTGAGLLYWLGEPFEAIRASRLCLSSVKALLPGLTWGAGNVLLLLAMTHIGVAIAFTLTRLSVAISSLFGVFYFKEAEGRNAVPVLAGALTSILGSVALSLAVDL